MVPFCDGGAFGSFRTPDEDGGVNVEVFCGSLGGSSALVEGGALGSTLDGLEDAILAGTVRTIESVLILAADKLGLRTESIATLMWLVVNFALTDD